MPPRHGKSEFTSRYFPAWFLGTHPDRRVILTAYEATFASSWGRKARDLLAEHGVRFGVSLGTTRSDWWEVAGHDGSMMTAGVGGPIVGKGADLLIFDDPIKNADEASSPTYRARTWDWWQSTAYTRLEPDGAVVGIMTRWHEDDLIGRILANARDSGEEWEVLNLPALAEDEDMIGRAPGEALWPDRFSRERLLQIKHSIGPYYWSALYQGVPVPREGGFFRLSWFDRLLEAPPEDLAEVVRGWDLASSPEGDYTVGAKIAKTASKRYVILDVVRGRWTPAERDRIIRQTAELDGHNVHQWFEQEPGSAGKSVAHALAVLLEGYPVHSQRSTGSKMTRADAFSSQLEAGNVLLMNKSWVNDLIAEFTAFPNAKHDDQVDASALAFNRLAEKRVIQIL